LRPGVAGLSENVRVTSIVGRFLEHARVIYFQNGGDEEFFIGSADLMTRNLESRVEVLTPIEAPELRSELKQLLALQLEDRRAAWDMQADGSYVQRTPKGPVQRKSSQEKLIELMQARHETLVQTKQSSKKRVRTRRAPSHRRESVRPAARASQPAEQVTVEASVPPAHKLN
jgi:polyphosphate kinase